MDFFSSSAAILRAISASMNMRRFFSAMRRLMSAMSSSRAAFEDDGDVFLFGGDVFLFGDFLFGDVFLFGGDFLFGGNFLFGGDFLFGKDVAVFLFGDGDADFLGSLRFFTYSSHSSQSITKVVERNCCLATNER